MLKDTLRKCKHGTLDFLRKIYYSFKKRRLKNYTPTIIASNCLGTFMYHNLGLKFMTPTINLFIEKEHFCNFVLHLKEYLEADLKEMSYPDIEYPVGYLEYMGKPVVLHFVHYPTFEDARKKWNERKKRVSFENIYILNMIPDVTEDDIREFDALPYKNKMLVADDNPINSPNVVVHPIFKRKDYQNGDILFYKTTYSIRRNMDTIDYVSFLNRPN